jgi:hypothetical protein
MLDQDMVNELRFKLADRFTVSELADILVIDIDEFIDTFLDKILETSWSEFGI